MKVYGDVRTVIEGRVEPGAVNQVSLDEVQFALGAGSYSDLRIFGETIVLAGCAFGTWVNGSGRAHTESATGTLATPFLLAVEAHEAPASFESVQAGSLQALYSSLLGRYPKGCIVVGVARFSKFDGAYLKRSPIYHENINTSKERYWHLETLEETQGWFVGFLARDHDPRCFYENPGERTPSTFLSHTHAALVPIAPFPKSFSDLSTPPLVLGARHLFTSSELRGGKIAIFSEP